MNIRHINKALLAGNIFFWSAFFLSPTEAVPEAPKPPTFERYCLAGPLHALPCRDVPAEWEV